MANKHSPLPWKTYINGSQIGDNEGGGICAMWRYSPELPDADNVEAQANADFMVKACNNYYDLIKILKKVAVMGRSAKTDNDIMQRVVELEDEATQLLTKLGE